MTAMPLARICRRLDGIPLALDLAASRLRLLTVEQLADRLETAWAAGAALSIDHAVAEALNLAIQS